MLDHANLTAMVAMITTALDVTAADRCLLILPLFHVNGILVSVLSPLAAGGCTTITGRFSPSTFFDTVEAVRPTYFSAVPAIYAMLSALPDDVDPDISSVRFAICGAAPMPAELIARFEQRYGTTIVEGYGLSECTCVATLNPVDGPRKAGTVGLPLPGQEVALLDTDGRPTTDGQGEVIVRGPNVMRGYLNKPEETARTLEDGWLHTGDVGYFDADGYLVLVDRVKDMIIRGGENIYPKEIENVLYTHPAGAGSRGRRAAPRRARRGTGGVRRTPRPGIGDARGTDRAVLEVARPVQGAAGRGHPRRPAEEQRRQDRQARAARTGDDTLTTRDCALVRWAPWNGAILVFVH